MPLLYNFDVERPEELLAILAQNLQKRRLEKGLSREALTELSGVPTPTIAKFEQKHTISLASYVALAKALGYSKAIKELLSEPLFSTMEELEMINKNKNRKFVGNSINHLLRYYPNAMRAPFYKHFRRFLYTLGIYLKTSL